MKISIITLFPKIFDEFKNYSMIYKALKKGPAEIEVINLRDYGLGPHKQVDDRPYGGGAGMVMRIDVIEKALSTLKSKIKNKKSKLGPKIILLAPTGEQFTQKMAQKLAKEKQIVLICGHYEGVDARVEKLVDEKISIGPYVTSGGEVPAMVVMETIIRLLPGVLGNKASLQEESFTGGLLEYPQYTRPEVFKKMKVPEVLLSGNHQEIEKWRRNQQGAVSSEQ
jgi:tRNA (guanine37-N1)-methyltransferase